MLFALAATALVAVTALGALLAQTRGAARRRRQQQERFQRLQLVQVQREQEHRQLEEYCEQLSEERDELHAAAGRREQESGELLVNLALRSLTLVERQLGQLEGMEGGEADSVRLEQLYRLDHLATRMRRNNENMLLLGGAAHQRAGHSQQPTSLLDVLRAALSEIERYEDVHLTPVPQLWIRPDVAEDLSHLFAELLENGTAFSPPGEPVTVTAWQLGSGELMVSIVDRGIGIPEELLRDANVQLATGAAVGAAGAHAGRSMGLQVVTILAVRHGLRVQLRASPTADGTTALVAVPTRAFAQAPAPEPDQAGAADWGAGAAAHAARPLSAVPGSGPDRTAGHAAAAHTTAGHAVAGLPKRVPGESGQLARGADREPEHGFDGGGRETGRTAPARPGANAEELRRRLGGFQQGVRSAAPIRVDQPGPVQQSEGI